MKRRSDMWKIVAVIASGLVALATAIFGVDQYQKRQRDQARFRAELQRLDGRLSSKEAELADLSARLGKKNNQVRTLAAEVRQLRAEVAGARRRVA
jgi:chromosome segregation ATPase